MSGPMSGPMPTTTLASPPAAGSEGEARPPRVVHGTAVAWHGKGILLLGPSGSGKSDLALRLIDAGAVLVADDLVRLAADGSRLVARPHGTAGLLELRGQGIFRLPAVAAAAVDLVVRLELPADPGERLPAAETLVLAGLSLPVARLEPFAASAVARLRLLVMGERVL